MSSIAELFGLECPSFNLGVVEKFAQEVGAQFILDTPPRILDGSVGIGIEVEVENLPRAPELPVLWRKHADNSLRNHGVEYVSWPLHGRHVAMALRYLFYYVPLTRSFSPRTSIHIHLDVLQLDPDEVAKILLVYLACERLLYRWVGRERADNIFCVPWYATDFMASAIERVVALTNGGHLIQREDSRYSGLNLHSLCKFGTMEFRQLYGTADVGRIMEWINLLLAMRLYALSMDRAKLEAELVSLNTNSAYSEFVYRVFGPAIRPYAELAEDIMRGIYVVKYSLAQVALKGLFRREAEIWGTKGPGPYSWYVEHHQEIQKIILDAAAELPAPELRRRQAGELFLRNI